jgi:hypothetical protein
MKKNIEYNKVGAAVPEYTKGLGDCTVIYFIDGKRHLKKQNINRFMEDMADYYCVNLKANRRVYGKELNIKNKVPYIFSDKHVMVPYKSRKPINKRDGASGYFDVNHFQGFVQEGDGEYILLKNGVKLKMEQKSETCGKYVNYAKLLLHEKR